MENGNRELGEINARLHHLEVEMEKLRVARHDHANYIGASTNWIEVFKLQNLDERLKALESWRQRIVGVSAAIGIIFGIAGGWIAKQFG